MDGNGDEMAARWWHKEILAECWSSEAALGGCCIVQWWGLAVVVAAAEVQRQWRHVDVDIVKAEG